MQRAVQHIKVLRHDESGIQATNFLGTGSHQSRVTVQDGRRSVNVEKVAGEQVAAEEQIVLGAVKATMPECVTRQMNHAQSTPERKLLAVADELINLSRTIPKDKASRRFQTPAPFGLAGVRVYSIHVCLLGGMTKHPRPSPLLQPGQIARVIKMPVSEQNGFD